MQQKLEKLLPNNIINPVKQKDRQVSTTTATTKDQKQQQQQQPYGYYSNYPPQEPNSNSKSSTSRKQQQQQQDDDLMYDTIVPDNIGVYKRSNTNSPKTSNGNNSSTTTNTNGQYTKPQKLSDKLSYYYNEEPNDQHFEPFEEEDLYTNYINNTNTNSGNNKNQTKNNKNNTSNNNSNNNSLYDNTYKSSNNSNNSKSQQQINPSQSLSESKKQLNISSTTYSDYGANNNNSNIKNNMNNNKASPNINNNTGNKGHNSSPNINNNTSNGVKETQPTINNKSNKKSKKLASSAAGDFDSDLGDDFDDFVEIEEKDVATICQLYYIHFYQTPEMIRNETQKWLEERWFLPANFKDIKWNQPNRFFFPVYVFTIVTTTFFDATFILNDFPNTIQRQKMTSTHEELIFCASNSMDSVLVDQLIKENSYSSRSTRYLPPNEELVQYNTDTLLSEKVLTIDISKNEIWENKVLPFIKDEEKKKCLKFVQKTYSVKNVELEMDEPMIDSEIYSIVFLPISSQTYQYSGAYYATLTSGNKGKTVGQRPIGTGYVGGAIYDVVSKVSNIVQDSIGM